VSTNTSIPTGLPLNNDILYKSAGPVAFDGDCHWFLMTDNIPTTGEIATLLALGNTDPTITTLTTASPSLLWTGVNSTLVT
jgi:hypothetical protein